MEVGKRIQQFRKQAGLTQKQLAERVGVVTGTIQQYELGKREPRFEQLSKIAEALDIAEADLYGKDAWLLVVQGHAETYHSYEKMGYTFSESERKLIGFFGLLNEAGKATAIDRISELTEIPKYVK